ncbi:MAG: hypothetical protein JNL74_21755 [Fibrobacteres bacterium]|nr:hypothetical protein [Fibrobacterota bacterium]
MGLISRILITACAVFMASCDKAVELDSFDSPYDNISISSVDSLIASVDYSGKVSYNQAAYKITVLDQSGNNISASEPVVFRIYRYFPPTIDSAEHWEVVAKLFRGGKEHSVPGVSRIRYRDESGLDTLVYKGRLDTLLLTGSHNKRVFKFAVAAVTSLSMSSSDSGLYEGGIEHRRNVSIIEHGGALRSFFALSDLNGDKYTTADSRVRIKTRLNIKGLDTLYVVKASLFNDRPVFSEMWRLDSILRLRRVTSDVININSKYKMRLADSIIFNVGNVEVGRFAGVKKIPITDLGLASYFKTGLHRFPADSVYGEDGWIDLEGIDTLPRGVGTKFVFLHNSKWTEPYFGEIAIRDYSWEISLNESMLDSVYSTALGYLVAGDRIPFELNTFGDSTFSSEVEVWLLTTNLSSRVFNFANNRYGFNTGLDGNNTQGNDRLTFTWPDALIETKPVKFRLNKGTVLRGELLPDYERGYRVSPFWYHSVSSITEKNKNDTTIIDTITTVSNSVYQVTSSVSATTFPSDVSRLSLSPTDVSMRVNSGSILGYSDKYLDNQMVQDSAIVAATTISKMPYVGRFTAEDLNLVAPDSVFDSKHILRRYGSVYNMNLADFTLFNYVYDGENVQTRGRHFMARFSQFVVAPGQDYSIYGGTGPVSRTAKAKLFKNPMRSLPYFSKNAGYKEFVLCVVGRGKFFGERRVLVSAFAGSKMFYWDKIPPKIDWPKSFDPKIKPYAPLYTMNNAGIVLSSYLERNLVPFKFDVSLDSVIDRVSSVTSIKLKFGYSQDYLGQDPVTGRRNYRTEGITIDVDRSYVVKKLSEMHTVTFPDIDARSWRAGNWDMWVETEDALGNRGVAPLINNHANNGVAVSVRTIKVNE